MMDLEHPRTDVKARPGSAPGPRPRPAPVNGGGPAVATRRLTKRYGRETALASLDLTVPEGAVYLLVGPNGAGKTTTIRTLMNLVRPDAGTAEVFGMDSGRRGPLVRAQIGYVPERHDHGYGWMTCGRLIRHHSAFFPAWNDEYAQRLIERFEIRAERKVGQLSKGQARRLQLLLALAHRPPLLLLDEPTDGLDPVVRSRTLKLLAEHIADTPTTVLISTHQVYEVDALADHLGVLHAGRLIAQMPRDELHRTVRRYRVQVPDDWRPPAELADACIGRSGSGREIEWTVVGEEADVTARFTAAGAYVREVVPLGLEAATLAFLENEVSR